MIYNFEDLRPKSNYPKYPPYVTDDNGYLETYFYNYYLENKDKFDAKGRTLLPIWWTTLSVDNSPLPIQNYIDVLPKDHKWFTVSQHDDGIKYRLPPDTIHFGAGGLGGGIPIPLICSSIPEELKIRDNHPFNPSDFLFSFIGSITHPIRHSLSEKFGGQQPDDCPFYFSDFRNWSQTVENSKLEEFIGVTMKSKFSLAPRGYGLSSFRLYEIMQLGSIPVYVSDKHWLPWQDELNWEEFCVIITPEQIPNLYNILNGISEEKRQKMLNKIQEVYKDYFSLDGVCQNILKRL